MVSELIRNGGVECPLHADPSCTHVVVDDANVTTLPPGIVPNSEVPVVKNEWFWASIQVRIAMEILSKRKYCSIVTLPLSMISNIFLILKMS